MHGTVEMLLTITQFAQVNGRKEKLVPIYALNNERKTKNSSMQELFRIRAIKVLRGNFSAVDLGEEPCNNSLPEKGKLTERNKRGQTTKRYGARRKERQRFCKRVSAKRCRFAAPFVAISFRFLFS